MEATVRQEAKEIKDHLAEMNAKQSSRGEFLKTLLLCSPNRELPNCGHLY